MTPEYFKKFLEAASRAKLQNDALTYAIQNFNAIQQFSEKDTLAFMVRFDLVFAAWFDPSLQTIMMKRIKGPDEVKEGMMMNAIPVADEEEAIRWSELFAGTIAPRTIPKPRLIAKDGTLLNPDHAKEVFIRQFFKATLESALGKNYTFESPRDDNLIAQAVARCDWTIAIWEDQTAPSGYRMLPISGYDKILDGSGPENARTNAFLVPNEATALKWQAIHGDPNWQY